METCFENFARYRSYSLLLQEMQRSASEQNAHSVYDQLFGPVLDKDHASSPERQHPSSVVTEDEETRDGPLNDMPATASSEVRATVSIFRDWPAAHSTSLVPYMSREMPVNTSPRPKTSFQNTISDQPYHFPSTSFFNPYGEHGSHPAYGSWMQPNSTPNNVVGDNSDDSPECSEPADVSMPNHDVANDTGADDYDGRDSDRDSDTLEQASKKEQPGSPIRYPTYTHLSDVSNDSVEYAGVDKQPRGSYSNARTRKHIESDFVPPLHFLSYLFLSHPFLTNQRHNTIEDLAEVLSAFLGRLLPREQLRKLFSRCLDLADGSVLIRELCAPDNVRQSVLQQRGCINEGRTQSLTREATPSREHHRDGNQEGEVTDFTEDDDENGAYQGQDETQQPAGRSPPSEEQQQNAIIQPALEQMLPVEPRAMYSPPAELSPSPEEQQQNVVVQPPIEKMLPGQPRAMYTLAEKSPPLGAECCTPAAHLAPSSVQEFVLPSQLNELGIQSAAAPNSIIAPQPVSPMKLSSPQPISFLPSLDQNCTTEKQAENLPEAMVPTAEPFPAHLAELSPSDDYPMESLFVAEIPVAEQSPPMEAASMPGTSESLVAPPTQQDEGEELAGACKRKSREPWDHKGLVGFVARQAFTLPHHVWIERKEGEPRRSKRVAMKRQVKIYYLRERLSPKSASDKTNG